MAKMPNYYKTHTDGCTVELEPIYEELVPVMHGEWNSEYAYDDWNGNRVYEHSHLKCGHRHENYLEKETANFCPNCGADMRGRIET